MMRSQEKWIPITRYQGHSFDGTYEVSNWGNVRKREDGRPVPFYSDARGQGYMKFKLYDTEHVRTAIKVHRLVASLFVGGAGRGLEVDHIDGNVRNNSYTNLRWVPHDVNVRCASRRLRSGPEQAELFDFGQSSRGL